MSFQNHLENLRSKPEHIRKRIAFWSSFGITAIIFTFWAASFSITGTKVEGSLAAASTRVTPPAQSMIAGVGGFFTDLKDLFFKPKKIEYAEIEVKGGGK